MLRDLWVNIIGGIISAFLVSAILKWRLDVDWLETAAVAVTVFILAAWFIQMARDKTQSKEPKVMFRKNSDDITVTGGDDVKIATRSGKITGNETDRT